MVTDITGLKSTGGSGDAAVDADDVLDRLIATVPGLMDRGELELLRAVARRANGVIVELGTAYGLSTIALALGAHEESTNLVTVDAFASMAHGHATSEPTLPDDLDPPTEARVRENLAAFGVTARIVNGLSWDAAVQVDEPVALLFVDADHTREAVEKDLAAWAPKLAPDGIIAFHDYGQEVWGEVADIADAWAKRYGWHKGERAGYLQIFYRVAPAQLFPVAAPAVPLQIATSVASAETLRLVQSYVQAFGERDLVACVAHFTADATVLFLTKRFTGWPAIEQWHTQRFVAQVEILSLGAVSAGADTVTVEAVITSKRLRWWRIKIRGSAVLRLDRNQIKELSFGSGRFIR